MDWLPGRMMECAERFAAYFFTMTGELLPFKVILLGACSVERITWPLKHVVMWVGFFVVLFLVGCNGGGDEAAPNPSPSTSVRLTALDSITTEGKSHTVVKDGDHLYVATLDNGLLVFDISGNLFYPPVHLGFNDETVQPNSIIKSGGFLYVAAGEGGMLTVDVSDPANPELVSSYNPEDQYFAGVLAAKGKNIFLSDYNQLVVLKTIDPSSPSEVMNYSDSDIAYGGLGYCLIDGDFAYVAQSFSLIFGIKINSFHLFDVSQPASPRRLGTILVDFKIWSMANYGEYLLVGGEGSGLYIYDGRRTSDFIVSSLATSDKPNPTGADEKAYQIVVKGHYAYMADGKNGIAVVDLHSVAAPKLVCRVETGGEVTGIAVEGDLLVATDETTGVHLFRIEEFAVDLDTDGDGTPDMSDLDDDHDGFLDAVDGLPLDNTESMDTDHDGIGNNADLDDDNDGVLDTVDDLPLDPTDSVDTDDDDVGDNTDAFPNDASEWLDTDGDGIGNSDDLDDDGDARTDTTDIYPLDTDNAGHKNIFDPDDDNDGHLDADDAFPLDEEEWADLNHDDIGDNFPNNRFAVMVTNYGTITLELFEDLVPLTTKNFIRLAHDGFYDGLIFHRVIAGFMNQGGDPNGNGTGGPGYKIVDEFPRDGSNNLLLTHDAAGILSMAKSADPTNKVIPNTGGSQFFITVEPRPTLDGDYSVFGRVVEGLDVVQAINAVATDDNDKPLVDVVMESVTITTE